MSTTTRGSLRAQAANLLGLLAKTGTATGGTTSTLIHATGNAALLSSLDSSDLYQGHWLLMTSGVELGNWREIASFAPLTGTLTVAEAFGTGPSNGDTYEIYAGLDPGAWSLGDNNSIVDVGLTRCLYRTRGPVTLIADGDMETAGVGSWTFSNATGAKNTSEAITSGTQSLVVSNTGTSGYAQSASVSVLPSAGYKVWASFRGRTTASVSTATLIAYDVTNGAAIYSSSGTDSGVNYRGGLITFSFNAPATCRQVALRLQGTEAGAIIAWDDVILLDPQSTQYSVPSWLTTRDQLWKPEVRDGSRPFAFQFEDAGWPLDIEDDPTAVAAFVVNVPKNAASQPIYIRGVRAFGPQAATADSTTVNAPPEWAKYEVAAAAYDSYAVAIQQNSQGRVSQDRDEVEKRLVSLRRRYTPRIAPRLGYAESWVGQSYGRLAG